jgi:hypothetical protein
MTPTIEDVASRIAFDVMRAIVKVLEDNNHQHPLLIVRGKQRLAAEELLKTELAALVESRDALLRECRAIVQDRKGAWEIVDKTFHQYATERAKNEQVDEVARCSDLLKRIDAVIGGG